MGVRLLGKIGLVLLLGLAGWLATVYADFYCDKWTNEYHAEDCEKLKDPGKGNYLVVGTEPEAEARGFYPCHSCLPPVNEMSRLAKTRQVRSVPVKRTRLYIGDADAKICHQAWCNLVDEIKAEHKVTFHDIDEAWDKNYQPCQVCHPPVKPRKNNQAVDETPSQDEDSALLDPDLE